MSALVDTARRGRVLRRRDLAVGLLLTGTSGAGLLSHVVGPVPLSYSAPFVVLPSAAILAGVLLAGSGRIAAVGLLADRLIAGLWWGLVATAAYDGVRPLVVATFRFSVNPFLAMPIFGHLITGRPSTDGLAVAVGWIYHTWNGITFGMMFALVRPRGGWLPAVVWGLTLQGLMLVVYPSLIGADVGNTGFFVTGVIGHTVWGIVLGTGLARRAQRG